MRAAQFALACLFAALVMVRASERYWPIVAWPVYRHIVPAPLPETADRLDVRVVTAAGERWLSVPDLIEDSRRDHLIEALAGAAADPDAGRRARDRDYVLVLTTRAVRGVSVDTVEIWRTRWAVDGNRVPPIATDSPLDVHMTVRLRPAPR
jgi:hypothetical protein